MEMAIDFESKFFDALQDSVSDVKGDIKDLSKKIDDNTKTTNQIKARVDKLDGKVFGRKSNSLASLFGDRQLISGFVFVLLVFLLIVAAVLHIKIPNL